MSKLKRSSGISLSELKQAEMEATLLQQTVDEIKTEQQTSTSLAKDNNINVFMQVS